MSEPRPFYQDALIRLTGFHAVQRALEQIVNSCQSLRGLGSGGHVARSGERQLLQRLQPTWDNPVLFDIGANQGQYAEIVGQVLGPSEQFRLYSFEPSPQAFIKLQDRFGKDQRFRLQPLAFANEEGQGHLFFDQPGSLLSSMIPLDRSHWGLDFSQSLTVEKTTLDAFCQCNDVTRINLLKLDVEGMEMEVLRGASRMLSSGRIDHVCFEFGAADIDAGLSFRDFYRFFQQLKMKLWRITPSGYLQPIHCYTEHLEVYLASNYLASYAEPGKT